MRNKEHFSDALAALKYAMSHGSGAIKMEWDEGLRGISCSNVFIDEIYPIPKINWDKYRLQQKEEIKVGDLVEYLGGCDTWDNKDSGAVPIGARFYVGKLSDCGKYAYVDKAYPEYTLYGCSNTTIEHVRKISSVSISGGCSCGGRLDTHKAECPESKDANGNTTQSYTRKFSKVLEKDETEYTGLYYPRDTKKCECGAESIGANSHSDWCAKHDKN